MLQSNSLKYWSGVVVILSLLNSCRSSSGSVTQPVQTTRSSVKNTTYINPVFEPILADPTVVRNPKNKLFYAYGTADNWGDGKGQRLVSILQSKDLVHWTWIGTAFSAKPNWKPEGGIWAPDVVLLNGKYIMYYAYSTWGDPNPGIGVALADKPEGPFVDQGKLFDSKSIDVPNSIDPYFFRENNRNYLFWGSFSDATTQGTFGIPLNNDGTQIPDLKKKFKVAAGDFEAVVIHKRKGYYYFIGSKGSCCEGEKSTYHVLVGRSKKLQGPYLDQEGRDLTQRGSGTLLLKGNDKFVGTGHTSRIITDDQGNDWLLYHAIDPKRPRVSTGGNRRMLLLDRVIWKEDWPTIEWETSSVVEKVAPVFK
ncbi:MULTISPECIES: family 43 glycosylhydrolase [Sphingobacterium]|uniref:Arabinan endo-1,5-alpha-L-arabinosidase n=1 Tax=Sphingobacterium athyrii TaxID=2152717 RepID=A0A363NZ67_9SPHI|nr:MULTISPECIES: family 43 glycosylhydrolase [Sphingobacterium]PUV26114.1 arabinan endo-1,5-alpha-L-arabinosidase [Sphingobacterium athyrii]QIH33014.1 family 43 glycosylhydrolase [Sphingobacterium sp. DR205]